MSIVIGRFVHAYVENFQNIKLYCISNDDDNKFSNFSVCVIRNMYDDNTACCCYTRPTN